MTSEHIASLRANAMRMKLVRALRHVKLTPKINDRQCQRHCENTPSSRCGSARATDSDTHPHRLNVGYRLIWIDRSPLFAVPRQDCRVRLGADLG
jgi:hypothetical protein